MSNKTVGPGDRNTTLADVMFNMHQSSGATDEYRKGLVVGVVGALMATEKLTFEQAVTQCCFHMPDSGVRLMVPDSWLESFGTRMCALRKVYILPV